MYSIQYTKYNNFFNYLQVENGANKEVPRAHEILIEEKKYLLSCMA
jgi:hypothetical protein